MNHSWKITEHSWKITEHSWKITEHSCRNKKVSSCPLPVSGDSLEFTHTQQTNLFAANLHHALVLEV